VKLHLDKIKAIIIAHKSLSQELLIYRLNPVIRGWSNYYSSVVSAVVFKKLDHLIFQSLKSWAFRRHPNKGKRWSIAKYWSSNGGNNWAFISRTSGENVTLRLHTETPIIRHIKVQAHRSPFDGEWLYWSSRLGKYPGISINLSKLLKKQQGRCKNCGLYFTSENTIKLSHICPLTPEERKNSKAMNWYMTYLV
jgi:RNA-directed DNA polymerase